MGKSATASGFRISKAQDLGLRCLGPGFKVWGLCIPSFSGLGWTSCTFYAFFIKRTTLKSAWGTIGAPPTL